VYSGRFYGSFGGTCCHYSYSLNLYIEDAGSRLFGNIGNFLPDGRVSHFIT